MRNFYSGIAWTPNPEITKKCSLKTGFAVHSKSDSLSSQFRNPCPVQNGIGVQYTPDFAYDDFLIQKTTPKRGLHVSFNSEAVSQHISRYAGFQALLSNGIKDPVVAMQVYRDKDAVEKCFDDLKNSLDLKRLRMHTSATVDGRLFVQFIALILISAIRKEMRLSKLIEKYTVRERLQEMKTLTKVKYSGKYGHILTEVTKAQRDILKALDIQLPGKT